MLSVSAAFKAQEAADGNRPRLRANLFFGNYALLQTAASSGAFSADYPAAGAVNGDRTELNIGAAATADNGIGQASFKSSGVPDTDPADSVWWSVTFAQAKYINYLKIYQRAGHGLTEYWVDAYFDGAWYPIAHRVAGGSGYVGSTTMPAGYGDEPYGDTPYGSPWPPYLEGEWPLTLAEIDLGFEVYASALRIRAVSTEVASDYMELVAVEVYRKVDVSSRVLSCDIQKKRDFRFENTLAFTSEVKFSNSDKFFSSGYTPTDAERMAGFTNEDLRSGVKIKIDLGFDLGNQVEYADGYSGYLNTIVDDTPDRSCMVSCRDFTQFLINRKDFSPAKFNVLIEDAVEYVLNRYNISSYEMDVDATYRPLVVFFTNGEYGLDAIRKLARAATDGDFFFSESGRATFKNYSSQNEFSINSYQKWLAYDTATNINFDTPRGCIRRNFIYDNFGEEKFDSDKWETVQDDGEGKIEIADVGSAPAVEYALHVLNTSRKVANQAPETNTKKELVGLLPLNAATPINVWFDLWIANLSNSISNSSDGIIFQVGVNNGTVQSAVTAYSAIPVMNRAGYYLVFQQGQTGLSFEGDSTLRIIRVDAAGNRTVIGYLQNYGIPTSKTRFLMQKNGTSWNIYANGVNILSATEAGTEITGLQYLQVVDFARTEYQAAASAESISADLYFQNLMYGYSTGATATYISQVIDRGPNYTDAGYALAEVYETANGTADFYIRLSNDGITWGSWLAISPPADITGLGSYRYHQLKVEMGGSLFNDVELPIVSEMAITWTEANSKYPASANISLQGKMLDSRLNRTNTLAGDNIIYNKFTVYSTMPVLEGSDTDELFNFFDDSGYISSLKPKYITTDTDFEAIIEGGMDTLYMNGSNPAAILLTFKSGNSTAEFIYKSPVRPKIRINVSSATLLTGLKLQGKKWQRDQKFTYQYTDTDSQKIYEEREFTYSSDLIQSQTHAQQIATKVVALYKEQKVFFEDITIRPTFCLQLNDRPTIYDAHEGLNDDFYIVAIKHHYSVDDSGEADVYTVISPVKII